MLPYILCRERPMLPYILCREGPTLLYILCREGPTLPYILRREGPMLPSSPARSGREVRNTKGGTRAVRRPSPLPRADPFAAMPPPRQKPPHRPFAIGGRGAVGQSRRKRKMSGPTVTCGPTNPGPTNPGPTNPGPPALAAPAPPSNAGRTRFLQKEEGYPATHNPPWIASPWGEAPPGVAPAGRRAPESWPPG